MLKSYKLYASAFLIKAFIIKAVRPSQSFLTVTPLGLVLPGGNTVAENIFRKMGKEKSLMKILREYSEASTVHGVSYVFSRSLPQVDRLLWTMLTSMG